MALPPLTVQLDPPAGVPIRSFVIEPLIEAVGLPASDRPAIRTAIPQAISAGRPEDHAHQETAT